MKFQDYYETLGVAKTASQAEIQRAFRKLARKFHPDLSKVHGAEERFKQINEAYEVLGDPEKRKRYDALGSEWENGQEFQPPPGFEQNVRFSFDHDRMSDFSDFFEAFFGQGAEQLFRGAAGTGATHGGGTRFHAPQGPVEAEVKFDLDEVARGGKKEIRLQTETGQSKTLEVTIPPGTTDGSIIRLAGQGGGGTDLHLKVALRPHAIFQVSGYDLILRLAVAPWEAALGTEVTVSLLDSKVRLRVPPGVQSGQRLRIAGKGLRASAVQRGDVYAEIQIVVPRTLSERERELFSTLSQVSRFNPRHAE